MKKQNKTAIIQARMGSMRLPGKVLMPINKVPALKYLYDRIKKSKLVDDIIIATTHNDKDDEIVKFCIANSMNYFCGDENNVLRRVYDCARCYDIDVIIDITGDCIALDPELIDQCVAEYYKRKVDYVSTDIWNRSFADGMDVQVYSFEILKRVYGVVLNKKHSCHSGWNIYNYKHIVNARIYDVVAPDEYKYPDLSIVLDTREDYELLCKIAKHFGDRDFTYYDIIDYLKANPELIEINKNKIPKVPGQG